MRPALERGREQPAAVRPGEAGLLANRDFRLYFAARIVSQLGDQLYVFAISWFVLDLTRSSFHMAALLALHSLAVMAVAPFSGLIADRVSRKKVMVGTDLLQAAVLLALLFLQRGGLLSIGALYGGTVLLGLCSAVFLPAATAIVPGLVGSRRIPEAVAAGQASANFCTILGMLLGGALYRFIGIGGVLLLNAASNLIAAAMVFVAAMAGSCVWRTEHKVETVSKIDAHIVLARRGSCGGSPRSSGKAWPGCGRIG